MNDTATQLEELAARAVTLYSRPTVALELVRLAEDPQTDARALKECVAQDPALTCKVMRVVNSSLYGLHRPVADLNQAIGLLGIKPLKLLVLGFSLPDALFAEVAARELQWYWTNTLTRAVAARILGEELWHQRGDEAFIAGLLSDIGILVLLRELGEPYARFLTGVIDEKCHLASLEQDTLGFDHLQLSAALLERWQLPARLVEAIAAPKRMTRLGRLAPPDGDLPQILHLAELLMQLVGQQRHGVLPELLEAGKVYRGMTKSKLAALVESLQPQVDQLAEVFALELAGDRDYVQVLLDAQCKMALLSEEIAGERAAADEDHIYTQLLAHTGELTHAMKMFLAGKMRPGKSSEPQTQSHAAHYGQHTARGFVGRDGSAAGESTEGSKLLLRKLATAGKRCRERRWELSLLLVEPLFDFESNPNGDVSREYARRALARACSTVDQDNLAMVPLAGGRIAVVLSDCERRGGVALSHQAISALEKITGGKSSRDGDLGPMLSIGVATVSAVPKNFDAGQIVESATRCLSAARACGISAVKSIEV